MQESISEITEITQCQETIDQLLKENIELATKMANNIRTIRELRHKLMLLQARKRNEPFEYHALMEGNGQLIDSITVHGCQCLGKESIPCDGAHNIHVYLTNTKERINFNNERKFSMEELETLGYI